MHCCADRSVLFNQCRPELTCFPRCTTGEQCNYTCSCASGYVERTIQSGGDLGVDTRVCEDINECSSTPCANNATCRNLVNGFACVCAAGFTGDRCLTELNECTSDPCVNGGTCSDLINAFTCQCPSGFIAVTELPRTAASVSLDTQVIVVIATLTNASRYHVGTEGRARI